MKLLLHICCAPCLIYPLELLRDEGYDPTGIFYNPNIHPYREYEKRKDTLHDYAGKQGIMIWWGKYDLADFISDANFHGNDRCRYCYHKRIEHTALFARNNGYEGFTTTLLYSKYQKHDLIREICYSLAEMYGLEFVYRDFRIGWATGVSVSKELGMYRQPYCGCLYSEKERFCHNP
ncbi:MAG: epoxyqueuosine reductase QueH [Smithellaceae bacterium]|nr:epoxyqueuosine reductase QueH [Smithellaceae bacterium]